MLLFPSSASDEKRPGLIAEALASALAELQILGAGERRGKQTRDDRENGAMQRLRSASKQVIPAQVHALSEPEQRPASPAYFPAADAATLRMNPR